MKLSRGMYHWDDPRSDVGIEVIKVSYEGKDYSKVKAKLFNKRNGIVYDSTLKNYKLYHKNISHWKRYNDNLDN